MTAAASVFDPLSWPDRAPWKARVSVVAAHIEGHGRSLSTAECVRAARSCSEPDRLRFVAARGSLRQRLGQRLAVPALRGAPLTRHFDASHCGDWVLTALDSAAPIGIDVCLDTLGLLASQYAERDSAHAAARWHLHDVAVDARHVACWVLRNDVDAA